MSAQPSEPLLRVRGLVKRFPLESRPLSRAKAFVHAVDGADFDVYAGESLGIIGESGAGKTTLARLLLRLERPDEGSIQFREADGFEDVSSLRGRALKAYRRRVQMVFQDPYESINPRFTVYDATAEPLVAQGIGGSRERRRRVEETLERVGVSPAGQYLFRHPHELSGGQRQRVAIARALVLGPSLIVADEPVSMLDASVRAGVVALLRSLVRDQGVSCLYVTHDLATARYACDRTAVMHRGKIVEIGPTEQVLQSPVHPYTRDLVAASA
jgi:peptide/nickel transport system ATP-binding protein